MTNSLVRLRPRIMWFRRDLRLDDNPALLAAAGVGHPVAAVFVLEPDDGACGAAYRGYLTRSLRALNDSIGGRLWVVSGDPVVRLPELAGDIGADEVHVSADYTPRGYGLDAAVERASAERGAALVRTGSRYAVAPGRVRKPDGTPYKVFTPFTGRGCGTAGGRPLGTPRGCGSSRSERVSRCRRIRWRNGVACGGRGGRAGTITGFLGGGGGELSPATGFAG